MRYLMTLLSSLLVLAASAAWADEAYLRDNLIKARPGDFLVTAQGKMETVVLITGNDGKTLKMEEISVPSGNVGGTGQWREWVRSGAPGHTSWVAYEIDPFSGEMLEFYSYTKNAWMELKDTDNFLGTLLNLRLKRMGDRNRRRVGPMPREHESDNRPLWQPPMIVDGKRIPGVEFDVWGTHWPADRSELSNSPIEVYLPAGKTKYPTYFPYWLQVGSGATKAKVRIVDSGTGLKSPKQQPIGNRPPYFIHNGRFENGSLKLLLWTYPFFGDYILTAVEASPGEEPKPIPLSYSVKPTNDREVFQFEVPQTILKDKLKPDVSYRFLLYPLKQPGHVTMTTEPVRFAPL